MSETTLVSPAPIDALFDVEGFLEVARDCETEVLNLAEDRRLDSRDPQSREAILGLIAQRVQQRLSSSPIGSESPLGIELTRYIALSLLGLGPLELPLADPRVWEIIINDPATIFLKTIDGKTERVRRPFYDDDHVTRVLTRVLDRSTTSHRKLDASEGIQDAQLDSGARLHIVHRDLAKGGHLLVNIRKFVDTEKRSLRHLVNQGILSPEAAQDLERFLSRGATILFGGAPGAGKTTLMTAVINSLASHLRVVSAEEVFETSIKLANVAAMQTRPKRSDRSPVSLRELATAFLRMSPDAVVIGEVRDREVLPFLMTLSSGVQGFSTIHAKSARHALQRLRFLAQLSGANLDSSAITQLVSESIDLVVHLRRTPSGVRVNEIEAVEDAQVTKEGWTFSTTSLYTFDQRTDSLRRTRQRPIRLGEFEHLSNLQDNNATAKHRGEL